jgi:hypothetical protein
MTAIGHMRGLLDELGRLNGREGEGRTRTEGLNHLGAVNPGFMSWMQGYKYSIPLEIKWWGEEIGWQTEARWNKGGSLESAVAVAGQGGRDVWWELRDDLQKVYCSKRQPQPALTGDFAALQLEIEKKPKSERRLTNS